MRLYVVLKEKNKYSKSYTWYLDQYICLLTVHIAAHRSIHYQDTMYISFSLFLFLFISVIFTFIDEVIYIYISHLEILLSKASDFIVIDLRSMTKWYLCL